MAYLNRVQLMGNLGADPEVRTFPDGGQVANLSVATTKRWKDRDTGELKKRTSWHRVVVTGAQAATAGEHLKKGAAVYVEGELHTRKWQDKDGQDQYSTEVVNARFQFLDRKGRDEGEDE